MVELQCSQLERQTYHQDLEWKQDILYDYQKYGI